MKRWTVDRVTVFFVIAVVSFVYDLTAYLGIRNTARFPHPFVYFRSLGDVESFRGFPVMLRLAMFSLVAGGLIGWTVGLLILRNDWLTRATIRFLRIGMWIPFLVVFAAPYTFQLGIAVTLLAATYHYLTARSLLEMSARAAFRYAAGEVTLQAFFFSLISQIWVQKWYWIMSFINIDPTVVFVVWGLILTVVVVISWIFKRTFLAGCKINAILNNQETYFSKANFFGSMFLLTIAWFLFWQLTCVVLSYDDFRPIPAMQKAGDLLITHEIWHDIFISLAEVGGGVFFGGLLALAVSTVMHRSENIQRAIGKVLPATYISPIVLWLLVFDFLGPGVEHKMMGVGLLTFFPLIQTSWGFRDTPLRRRWLIAIDDALPIAFVTMCFGELYAATAGLGFQMVVAGATNQYQQGLAWFLITVFLLFALSMILRLIVALSGRRALPTEAA